MIGGITRFKKHLASKRGEIKGCEAVPKEVREIMAHHLATRKPRRPNKRRRKIAEGTSAAPASTNLGMESDASDPDMIDAGQEKGLLDCIETLEPDLTAQDNITKHKSFYEDALGDFSRPMALRGRETLHPETNGDISYLPWAREDLGLIAGAHPKKKHPRPRKASITLIQIAAGLPSPAENGAGRLLVPLLPPPAGSACRSDEWRGSRPLAELWMLMGAQKSIHAGKGWFLFESSPRRSSLFWVQDGLFSDQIFDLGGVF
ncbi:hypothetical protein GW17_00014665 [Ensete ventricosum]|nr:hypothetical protein GW17_00014665 [Ensete ventricosum]